MKKKYFIEFESGKKIEVNRNSELTGLDTILVETDPLNRVDNAKILSALGIEPFEVPSKFYPMNPKSETRNSKFSLDGSTITFTNRGLSITGRIIKNDNGYSVTIDDAHNLSDKKKSGLEKRMRDWYYYTHIQKK